MKNSISIFLAVGLTAMISRLPWTFEYSGTGFPPDKGLVQLVVEASPPGTISAFMSNQPPAGWLLCDGAEYLVADYPKLAILLKEITVSSDASSFKVPDLRGRMLLGAGVGADLSPRVVAQVGGLERVKLTESELPSHTHGVDDPSHSHPQVVTANPGPRDHDKGIIFQSERIDYTDEVSKQFNGRYPQGVLTEEAQTNIKIKNTGGSQSHENMPPFMVVGWIIKH
jgi:microcystin-dependent protein